MVGDEQLYLASFAVIDGTDFRAPGSGYTGTMFCTTDMNGQRLAGDRVSVHAPEGD